MLKNMMFLHLKYIMLWTMKGLKFLKVLKNFLFEKNKTNISFLNSTFVSNIIKKNVTQNVSNSNSVLSSYISDLFLQEKADVQISEKETYLNPYIICNQIDMKNSKLDIENLKILQQIFHFNLFFSFCKNLNFTSLCSNFRKQLLPLQKALNFDQMNNLVNKEYLNFLQEIQTMYYK